MDPLIILLLGIATVIGLIVFLRTNPFLALLAAALLVSFCSPSGTPGIAAWASNVERVAVELGIMAGKIGILLTMGAIIGKCMSESGAADRIVQKVCWFVGEKRLPTAMMSGGFLLSIPVFYDATFYLLLPLAKSVYRMTRRNYILYLLAIGYGATLSHTLIPPTPGPLVVAETMKIPIGTMMFFGLMVGTCMIPFALAIVTFINWYMPHPQIKEGTIESEGEIPESFSEFITGKSKFFQENKIPSFLVAILPILLPVLLIATNSVVTSLIKSGYLYVAENETLFKTIALAGNPSFALMLGALIAAGTLCFIKRLTLFELEAKIENALISAGMIILITSAGGAFGAMLRLSGVGARIEGLTTGTSGGLSGMMVLVLAFGVAAMIKTAQGSSTTAMITVSGIFAAMNLGCEQLGFHPGYLAVTIGIGSCVTGWMNDSGFCIFSRMSGIKETDALKTWTVGLTLLGLSGLLVVVILSTLFPMR